MMAGVNTALEQLQALFTKWGWDDWEEECQKMIDGTDTAKATKWLYATLRHFEAEVSGWKASESYIILATAGMVMLSEENRQLGALALLSVDPTVGSDKRQLHDA